MSLTLTENDKAMLAGEAGEGAKHAMEIVVSYAEMVDAEELIDVTSAHIDACLHHGLAGVEFAEFLRDAGAQVSVPSTLNVSSLDLLHPDLYRGDEQTKREAERLMKAYVDMGCTPTWTCAPYQLPQRPGLGEHIAWAESNAIVFANAVLGARTGRYGDFLDIASAVTGRVPLAGLHIEENRYATTIFDVSGLPRRLLESELLYPALGIILGHQAQGVPAIVGLPESTDEDDLKAIGAAGATSGALAMFHAVGITPEAPDLVSALGGRDPRSRHEVTVDMIRAALDELTTDGDSRLSGVSVGTPHFSLNELRQLTELLKGRQIHDSIDFFASTGRDVYRLAESEGLIAKLEASGVQLVVDTCTYVTPILRDLTGTIMTNSGKWAYYAPGNLGIDVTFGTLADCVESGVAGKIVRSESDWVDA